MVDFVNHTLKKLPSFFAEVLVYDTQFHAVGRRPPGGTATSASNRPGLEARGGSRGPGGLFHEAVDRHQRRDTALTQGTWVSTVLVGGSAWVRG